MHSAGAIYVFDEDVHASIIDSVFMRAAAGLDGGAVLMQRHRHSR